MPSSNSSKNHDRKIIIIQRRKVNPYRENINDDNSHYSQNRLQNINGNTFLILLKTIFFIFSPRINTITASLKLFFRGVIESEREQEGGIELWNGKTYNIIIKSSDKSRRRVIQQEEFTYTWTLKEWKIC